MIGLYENALQLGMFQLFDFPFSTCIFSFKSDYRNRFFILTERQYFALKHLLAEPNRINFFILIVKGLSLYVFIPHASREVLIFTCEIYRLQGHLKSGIS